MLIFLADEDFDNRIIRGLRRRIPSLDVLRVQDTEMASASDPEVIAWAEQEGRILLSHDVNTMSYHFTERLRAGLSSSGIVFAAQSLPVGRAIDDLTLIALYSEQGEYHNRILFLPLN